MDLVPPVARVSRQTNCRIVQVSRSERTPAKLTIVLVGGSYEDEDDPVLVGCSVGVVTRIVSKADRLSLA